MAILDLPYDGHLELLLVSPTIYKVSGGSREFEVWDKF